MPCSGKSCAFVFSKTRSRDYFNLTLYYVMKRFWWNILHFCPFLLVLSFALLLPLLSACSHTVPSAHCKRKTYYTEIQNTPRIICYNLYFTVKVPLYSLHSCKHVLSTVYYEISFHPFKIRWWCQSIELHDHSRAQMHCHCLLVRF